MYVITTKYGRKSSFTFANKICWNVIKLVRVFGIRDFDLRGTFYFHENMTYEIL